MIKRRSNVKHLKSSLIHSVFEVDGVDVLGCGAKLDNNKNYIPIDDEPTCPACWDAMSRLGTNTIKMKIKTNHQIQRWWLKEKLNNWRFL
jgi:hypothetical protein